MSAEVDEVRGPDPAAVIPGTCYGKPVTMGDLQGWIDSMPVRARAILTEGPADHGSPYGCGVCDALREWEMRSGSHPTDPMWDWHGSRSRRDDWSGVERYLRCILCYVLAGWDPEPEVVGPPAITELTTASGLILPPPEPTKPRRPASFMDFIQQLGFEVTVRELDR